MSIIENALKKAGSKGLVIQDNHENSSANLKSAVGVGDVGVNKLSDTSVGSSSERQVVIDWRNLAESGFINNNNAKSQLAEEFRVIKRPLVNNIQGAENNGINRSNLILICSSLPGEGKTFVSINLALSIANERDKSVLLIDADVEKPSISKQLGVESPLGLIEYLEDDKVNFSDILLKTDLPNLSIITAGKRHKYSTELLSSQRMYLFAEEVSRRYKDRIVIFDSPPLLVATQAQILAELVGQVVLVIAAEVTPQSVVNESVAKLSNCDVVMTLLNKTRKEIDIYGHNYGYGKYGHL
ncbi:XrtA-associated tyrosine autokinase [Methylomonas montana]|uniref:XrtA-associated tyrosine autokinase n=1 Tax=Methylomonas montana TaxID=3058963 RepID=UPI00265A3339|nr:XrtA-associated tyrosine autokinase [Methylomonas montana]WKJ91506.1 XrtA-associated tyrosine autokinase [Methylomonas montana]